MLWPNKPLPEVVSALKQASPVDVGSDVSDERDSAWLARVCHRDVAAFEALYDQHSSALFAHVQRIVGTRARAEAVLQAIFEEIWAKPGAHRAGRGSVFEWMTHLARKAAFAQNRAALPLRALSAPTKFGAPPTATAEPGAKASGDQRRTQLVTIAFQRLNAQEQQVLQLAYFTDATASEIGLSTGLNSDDLRHCLHGGMTKFRQ